MTAPTRIGVVGCGVISLAYLATLPRSTASRSSPAQTSM